MPSLLAPSIHPPLSHAPPTSWSVTPEPLNWGIKRFTRHVYLRYMHVAGLSGYLHSPLQDEVAYVRSRKEAARQALWHWLEGLSEPVDNGNISEDTPSIAFSLSGGNFLASLFVSRSVQRAEFDQCPDSKSVLEGSSNPPPTYLRSRGTRLGPFNCIACEYSLCLW